MKYNHLNREQRYQISALLKANQSKSSIARILKVHKSTITREIKRNSNSKEKYVAHFADIYSKDRRKDKPKHIRFTREMKKIIKEKVIKSQWSPEQIKGYCVRNQIDMVSHETIYQYIYKMVSEGKIDAKHLRTNRKNRRKRTSQRKSVGRIKDRVSIHARPSIIDERKRYGDWEVDLIEGENHGSFALTLVERKSRFALIQKLQNKKAKTVERAIVNTLAPYKKYVHSITSDNGKEFSNHKGVSRKLETEFYFADPYSSWQRGSSENTNKLFRQYLPKKSNLKSFDYQYFNWVQMQLNTRPRKILDYSTPIVEFLTIFDD